MCYAVYISSDSPEDLSSRNSGLIRFEKLIDDHPDPCTKLLGFPNRWSVGSKSGCGCTFRHLISIELGFSDPVEWCDEGQDEINATGELYATLRAVLSSGYSVDVLDRWKGARPAGIVVLDVSLDEISRSAFRLFENHLFKLSKSKTRPMACAQE
jgi:hypothetical protein